MSKRSLFALWGGLFIVCAGLGFIPAPAGILKGVMTVLAVAFFVPGLLLLLRGEKEKDRDLLKLIRNLAALSLALTLVLLVLSFLTALGSPFLGSVLHFMLVIVSSPMVCSGYWAVSLFLWACLLIMSLSALKKTK